MLGKYSPTVRDAYSTDQNWFLPVDELGTYDAEGYDAYGYNEDGVDREGNTEDFYINGDYDEEIENWESFCYERYANIMLHWIYDGKNIVRK